MSSLPAQHHRSAAGTSRATTYAACAIVLGFSGWLVTRIPDAAFVPQTAVLALAAAVAVGFFSVRFGMLASPLVLLAVPLLLSLAAAMAPITRIFGAWSFETVSSAALIVVAPLTGIAAVMLVKPWPPPRLERGTTATPRAQRLVVVCLLMSVVGAAVNVYEWASIGGPPVFSNNIDEARISLNVGVLHVFALGIPQALLIATWARIAHPTSFSALQRRALEAVVCITALVQVLGGGRSLVLVPLLTVLVVCARYVSRQTARRAMVVIPVVFIAFASGIFILRETQHAGDPVASSVLYSDTGAKSSPLHSAYRGLAIGLGEQLRVVSELQDANIRTPPFTTTLWFAHNFFPTRAVDPHTITGPNAHGWLTSTYAGPLMLDFGLIPTLLYGFLFGAAVYLLYLRFVRGRSVTIIWVYAYLAGPIAVAFYINMFLFFVYPILDVIGLVILSRLLVNRPEERASAAITS